MKNHWIIWGSFLLILFGVGIPFIGCSSKNNPTSPGPTTVIVGVTSTYTYTSTGTLTPLTSTATSTVTNTTTNSPTLTASGTPTTTGIPTSTVTGTPTFTPSNSPTATLSPTPTDTNVSGYTSTFTSTPTITLTPTISLTPTSTRTGNPSNTATGTPVQTSTLTPTSTSSVLSGSVTYTGSQNGAVVNTTDYLEVAVFADSQFNGGAIPVGGSTGVSLLAQQQVSTNGGTYSIPLTVPGPYYVMAAYNIGVTTIQGGVDDNGPIPAMPFTMVGSSSCAPPGTSVNLSASLPLTVSDACPAPGLRAVADYTGSLVTVSDTNRVYVDSYVAGTNFSGKYLARSNNPKASFHYNNTVFNQATVDIMAWADAAGTGTIAAGDPVTEILGVTVGTGFTSTGPAITFGDSNLYGSTSTPTSTASTPTSTPTSTVTTTLTATNTPVPCTSAAFLSDYTFDYGLQCWSTSDSPLSGVTGSYSTTLVHSGIGAFEATAPFSGTGTAEIDIHFASQANLTGDTITAWVYVDAPVTAGGGGYAQLFVQSGSGNVWESGGTISLSASQWVQLTFTPNWAASGENASQVQVLGIQVGSGSSATAGHIYLDDVVIGGTPATPTPIPGETWFDSSSTTALTGWSDYSNYWNAGVTTGPTPVVSGVSSYSPGYNSANCVTDNIQFTQAGQQDNIQYTWGTGNNDGANFTALGITGVRAWVETSAVFASGSTPGADAFANSGNYAGNENGSFVNLTSASTWEQVNYGFTWSNSGESATNVQQVGFTFYAGSSATSPFNTANVYVSNVELY